MDTIDPQTGRLTTNLGLDLGGNSLQNVSAIMSASSAEAETRRASGDREL